MILCEVAINFGSLSIYAICPDIDPTLIGLSTVDTLGTTYDNPFSGCASTLSNDICEAQLGWPKVAGGTYYGPSNLPASGTATLSNGAGTVTTPVSGAVFTYTNGANTQVYTISAVSVGKAVATTNSGGPGTTPKVGATTATGTGSAASTGSTASTSTSTSTKASAGNTVVARWNILLLGAGLVLILA